MFHRYSNFLNVLAKFAKKMREKGIQVGYFPTFRLEEVVRFLMPKLKNEDEETVLIHLLIYPTLALFRKWEEPMIVETMTKQAEILYGAENVLNKATENLKRSSKQERVNYLYSLLYEEFRFLWFEEIPEEFRAKEGFDKLQYITKYLAYEFQGKRTTRDIYGKWETVIENS